MKALVLISTLLTFTYSIKVQATNTANALKVVNCNTECKIVNK